MSAPDPEECAAILAALEIVLAARTRKAQAEVPAQRPSRWRAAARDYGAFEDERRR